MTPNPATASDQHSAELLLRHAMAEKRDLYAQMVELFRRDNPSCPQHVFNAYCVVLAEELGL
jgi:hypothetical protein